MKKEQSTGTVSLLAGGDVSDFYKFQVGTVLGILDMINEPTPPDHPSDHPADHPVDLEAENARIKEELATMRAAYKRSRD